MRRYSKLLAGASWIAEYGDPDKPEEWQWLKTYSAYHQAEPDRPYPPAVGPRPETVGGGGISTAIVSPAVGL